MSASNSIMAFPQQPVMNTAEKVEVAPAPVTSDKGKADHVEIERVLSPDDTIKDHMNYDRVDKELAKYANAARIDITPEENKRLKKMIDRRVLAIMIITYFIQALDKGTMSFAAIMGIRTDLNLHGQQV